MVLMSSASSSTARNPRRALGLFANERKNKNSFIRFTTMTRNLLLSLWLLGQKYWIHDLLKDTAALGEERETLTGHMSNIRREASLGFTGLLVLRLRHLFGDED
ncbi:hypothetical protein BT93_H1060 [Corymbia citriodora subsp. variegata]|nr:hypothetical protein BT93_H1060 [Corymbia citriodora subsp. variegata]